LTVLTVCGCNAQDDAPLPSAEPASPEGGASRDWLLATVDSGCWDGEREADDDPVARLLDADMDTGDAFPGTPRAVSVGFEVRVCVGALSARPLLRSQHLRWPVF
jgi:hypothetical protein